MWRLCGVCVALCAVCAVSAQIRIIPHEKLLEVTEPKTEDSSLRIIPDRVDFGTIDEMIGVWDGSTTIVNRGVDTTVITQVKSTCSCLRVELSKRLLAPKDSTEVVLKYYPRGHAGTVRQRVLIYTSNSNELPSAILEVQGIVRASVNRSDDYPYARGVLRLRQEHIVFRRGCREVQRIAIMNGGSVELNLEADMHLLPKGVSVRFEPVRIAPMQQGDMVVEYNPEVGVSPPIIGGVYIKGLNLSPRQSKVEVLFKD